MKPVIGASTIYDDNIVFNLYCPLKQIQLNRQGNGDLAKL